MIFRDIARGVGYFGTIDVADSVAVDGWILSTPEAPLDSFALYVDEELVATSTATPWPEAQLPAFTPAGGAMRFAFADVRPPFPVRELARMEVLGCASGQPVSRIGTLVRRDPAVLPAPPQHLMVRVTGNADAAVVTNAGTRCAKELLETLGRHRPLHSLRRVLDWGCGFGRVTMNLIDALAQFPGLVVEGCDIDPEAIEWAGNNVRNGAFTAVGPHPPLPWSDAAFDVVVACSVFTHLSRDSQGAWLAEMQRVIAPGGLLLASIFSNGTDFSDDVQDPALDGIAPPGYYRFTAQSRAHATGEWSRWFDIAEVVEYGLEGVQHLIVMRRRIVDGIVDAAFVATVPAATEPFVTPALATASGEGAFPPGHFYSPIPAWDEVARDADRIFRAARPLPGIDLRADGQIALFHELAKYYAELPYGKREGLRYTFDNPNYGHCDAIILHSMIRHLRPHRVVEVGSGYSSSVIVDTNELFLQNAIDCTFIDTAPQLLESLLHPGDRVRILGQRVQEVPDETFADLEANDILFIDSSHVLKTGSDLHHLLFGVLPRLRSGVLVHFHDVFYPFEYPRNWVCDLGLAWNEIYAVHAFLQYNSAFEIVFFNSYLTSAHEELFRTQMPLCLLNGGGSLWIRRC